MAGLLSELGPKPVPVRAMRARRRPEQQHVEDMAAHLEGRIDAFARVQTMAARAPGGAIDLASPIEDELDAGTDIVVRPKGLRFTLAMPMERPGAAVRAGCAN